METVPLLETALLLFQRGNLIFSATLLHTKCSVMYIVHTIQWAYTSACMHVMYPAHPIASFYTDTSTCGHTLIGACATIGDWVFFFSAHSKYILCYYSRLCYYWRPGLLLEKIRYAVYCCMRCIAYKNRKCENHVFDCEYGAINHYMRCMASYDMPIRDIYYTMNCNLGEVHTVQRPLHPSSASNTPMQINP